METQELGHGILGGLHLRKYQAKTLKPDDCFDFSIPEQGDNDRLDFLIENYISQARSSRGGGSGGHQKGIIMPETISLEKALSALAQVFPFRFFFAHLLCLNTKRQDSRILAIIRS